MPPLDLSPTALDDDDPDRDGAIPIDDEFDDDADNTGYYDTAEGYDADDSGYYDDTETGYSDSDATTYYDNTNSDATTYYDNSDGYDTDDSSYDDDGYYYYDYETVLDDERLSESRSGGPPPPEGRPNQLPRHDRSTADARGVLARLMIAGTVATLLSSQHLLTVAERMPFSRSRTVAVAAAERLDSAVELFRLDEPDRWIRLAIGRPLPDDSTGGESPLTAAGTLPSAAAPPIASQPETPAPTTTVAPTTTSEPPVRAIDETSKLRVWAGGDSLGEYVGNQLLHPLSDQALSQVELDYHISTGLTRPDFFNWHARMVELMTQESPPEALVFMIGGNDDQNMRLDGTVLEVGTDEWYGEYARRVASFMDASGSGASHLYWIGLPPMREQPRHDVARAINGVLGAQAELRPWVTFVDIEQRFTGPDGNFATNIADETGQQKVARAPDGIHITYTGSTWVAEDIWAAIGDRWHMSAEPEPTTVPPDPAVDPVGPPPPPDEAAPTPVAADQAPVEPAPVEPAPVEPAPIRPSVPAPPNRYQ